MPILVRYISDRSRSVRSEAGDAVGKIALGARRRWGERTLSMVDTAAVGEALLKRYIREQSQKWRNTWLPAALGAVGHRPAIPYLIEALKDDNPSIRGAAAWSLGILRAQEAIEPLRHALAIEKVHGYPRDNMWVALYEITEGRKWRQGRNSKSSS
jgi:HEAT repeat protein